MKAECDLPALTLGKIVLTVMQEGPVPPLSLGVLGRDKVCKASLPFLDPFSHCKGRICPSAQEKATTCLNNWFQGSFIMVRNLQQERKDSV